MLLVLFRFICVNGLLDGNRHMLFDVRISYSEAAVPTMGFTA